MSRRISPRRRRRSSPVSPPRALSTGNDNDTAPDDWAPDETVRVFPQDACWLDPDDDEEAQPEPGDFWIDPDEARED